MQILVRADDGYETDVTEGVRVAYDLVVASMNWGSGFLDSEEMGQVADLGQAIGATDLEEVYRDIERQKAREEKAARRRAETLAAAERMFAGFNASFQRAEG